MFEFINMPIWAWLYLVLVLLVFVVGFFAEYKQRDFYEIYGSVLSLFSICTLVVALFHPSVVAFLGLFVFPITVIGIYWEHTRAEREIVFARARLAQEIELDDEEREFLLNVAIGLNALLVVPGYVAGLVVCYNVIKAFFVETQ
jgi:energy-coupling factor transporter transmembrane protein EcfT